MIVKIVKQKKTKSNKNNNLKIYILIFLCIYKWLLLVIEILQVTIV